MSKCINIGIIGAGGIANGIHLPLLARENVCLRAVCDLVEDRAAAAQETFGIAARYTSAREMLAKEALDAVFVLTQPDALFRAARDALSAGKPVFMEKPMGVTAFQARTLRDLARERNHTLHVGYNRRFIPLVQESLRLLAEYGPLTQAEGWFYKNSSPAFYDGCASAFTCDVVHVVDLVRHAAGASCMKAATLEQCDPHTGRGRAWHSILQFENGTAGIVRSNYATGGRTHGFAFHAPGASAYVNLGAEGGAACDAVVVRTHGMGLQSLSAMGGGETETVHLDGKKAAGSDRYEDYYGYRDEDRAFLEAVRQGLGYDAARAEEDLQSALLTERLLQAAI